MALSRIAGLLLPALLVSTVGHGQWPASRYASGTTWQPDATPMHGLEGDVGEWRLMAHGNAFLAYARAETRKGGSRLGLPHWAMGSARRPLLGGELTLTVMGSAETLTVGDCGMPGLLASTGNCGADPFRDFDHPHPPLMELSARHQQRIGGPFVIELYGALAGEPALGPPAYFHRASAAADPAGSITAHETNPAHASAGIVSAGVGTRSWRLEGSLFNAAPADPDRILPDPGPLSASAARFSINPSGAWSLQASLARIPTDAAAAHHAGAAGPIRVATFSAMHGGGASATSLTLARMDDGTLPRLSALVESSLTRGASTGFARLEIAERVREELTIILNPDGSHQHLVDYHRMNVSQVAAGYLFSRTVGRAAIGLGARGAVSFIPRRMEPIYRSRHPTNFSLYANLHPAAPHQHH